MFLKYQNLIFVFLLVILSGCAEDAANQIVTEIDRSSIQQCDRHRRQAGITGLDACSTGVLNASARYRQMIAQTFPRYAASGSSEMSEQQAVFLTTRALEDESINNILHRLCAGIQDQYGGGVGPNRVFERECLIGVEFFQENAATKLYNIRRAHN